MEPDQPVNAEKDIETTQQNKECDNSSEKIVADEKLPDLDKKEEISNPAVLEKPVLTSDSLEEKLADLSSKKEQEQSDEQKDDDISKEKENAAEEKAPTPPAPSSSKDDENAKQPLLPSLFPGTVTKSVPGSNDVKIEIASSSLLDRVILYTLKNKVVDNSRLDAAKNKYILNNGNVNTNSFNINNNSNGSDSNSSSKSVEKLIEEFKGSYKSSNTSSNNNNSSSSSTSNINDVTPPATEKKSNGNELSNGAENTKNSNTTESNQVEVESTASEMKTTPPEHVEKEVNSPISENVKSVTDSTTDSINLPASKPDKTNSENEALDFREKASSTVTVATENQQSGMLDLTLKRDEKSVPPIKRHALYVGLPDFSKQIFTAPSITRTTNTLSNQTPKALSSSIGPPKVRNPDFSTAARAPELQMNSPDFSKGFAKNETQGASTSQEVVTPSNFSEIARKNNYISDLQLKPPVTSTETVPSSYKIDYRPPVLSQKSVPEQRTEQVVQPVYPNFKKERINYSQQLIDEPMAHVIHKNQFLPSSSKAPEVPNTSEWGEQRTERLLGGSSKYETPTIERKMPMQSPLSSNEDLKKLQNVPQYPPYMPNEQQQQRDYQTNEFSLKQKEQQLRQEGTIITIKHEPPARTPTNEFPERRSADLFRDYKLKHPKESPDSVRRAPEPPPLAYHQQYPDFPSNYQKVPVKPDISNVKINPNSPISPSEYQPPSRNYHTPSPVHHRQPKSPLTVPPGPSYMNPPQNWPPPPPPPLVSQPKSNMSSSNPPTQFSNQFHHQMPPKLSNSQAQSPMPQQHYPPQHYPVANVNHSFKYPEQNRIPSDAKNLQPSTSPNQNYYHQKYPDFARRFEHERVNYPYPESHHKYPQGYEAADTRQPVPIISPQRMPPRQDLEIRQVREQFEGRNIHIVPPHHYMPPQQHQQPPRMPIPETMPRQDQNQYSRIESRIEPRIEPQVKIERQMNNNNNNIDKSMPKSYAPLRRPDVAPELSIIPKMKSEPAPTTSSAVKPMKPLFGEVKRESPLDLSVKTVKTKADSTGCDQDYQSRFRTDQGMGLKVEFTPNFANASKTECRQQARLGPQDCASERSSNMAPERAPQLLRFPKEVDPNRINKVYPHQPQVAAPSSKNHFYDKKHATMPEIERPHAPVPSTMSDFGYSERQPIPNMPEMSRQAPGPSHQVARPYETAKYDPKFQNDMHNVRMFNPPVHPVYPVINKPFHAANVHENATKMQMPPQQQQNQHQPINSKDPLYLERERDRKKVEEMLYGKGRREEPKQFSPNPSPPRKRHLTMMQSQHYGVVPPKQNRIDEVKPFNHMPINYGYAESIERKAATPPTLIRHESYQRPPTIPANVNSNNNNSSNNNNNNITSVKHYPDPRKDAIKSEMMSYNAKYYQPNATKVDMSKHNMEMIHRSEPTYGSNKFYPSQNFHQRPDDNTFTMHSRLAHPVHQESIVKIEQPTPGPLPEISGEMQQRPNGGIIMPPNMSGSNGNIARGADQSTIQKLKSNLEFKEQQKLKIQRDDIEKKDLSPRQFRTKGELKGYTPLPTSFADKTNAAIVVAGDSNSAPSAFDLLDWGSACNDFVQQLQTGKKRAKKKRPNSSMRSDIKQEDKLLSRMPGTAQSDLSEVPKDVLNSINSKKEEKESSSSDDDKPLVDLKNMTEKMSRNFREKQRLETEQKFAARLGRPSSSESETDIRKVAKSGKRVRRLRKRAALGIKKTDDEHSADVLDSETDDDSKRKSSKSLRSKLDDLTSSEEDNDGGDKRKTVNGGDKKHERKSEKSAKSSKKQTDNKTNESSSETSESSSEEETTETKINKLASAKNAKRLKDLGDGSNFKVLLQEEETMTRSKRKLEIEKKLSNSKILRNEKVVQNVLPDRKAKIEVATATAKKSPLKRKDSTKTDDAKRGKESESEKEDAKSKGNKRQRKTSKMDNSSSSEDSELEGEVVTERLRPRKVKQEPETGTKAAKKKTSDKDVTENDKTVAVAVDSKQGHKSPLGLFPFREDKPSKFTPGWEAETYNFKRSLKIPPGLITIARPPQLRGISHSLPDLDPQTSDTSEIFSEFVKSKDKEGTAKDEQPAKKKSKISGDSSKSDVRKKPSSIIDVLHQRVIQSKKKLKTKKGTSSSNSTPKGNSNDNELLLPTPEKESEKVFGFKKNIFETFIITSRTRTENNAHKKKEVLKEVFGADDERPRSAPPSSNETVAEKTTQDKGDNKKISYDQKYREYLEKMNVDFLDKKKLTEAKCDGSVKDEEEDFDDNETVVSVVASERDLVTPTLKSKAKKSRSRRCKGSSGFDYIRKKKKPVSHASENPLSVNNMIKKRLAAMESLDTKDENDISKEIKGWVLNKGVGESVLHKAARLDYVDVVAYCLDRLNMNPDPKDNAGYTPLHEACSRGHLEIARLLLQYGANHSETAQSGIRPLHEAIENGHIEMVRLLLSFGADPCLATYSGQLPISMAEDKEMENFLNSYLIDIDHKGGPKTTWYFEGAFKIEDPDEIGYDVFDNVPINKTDLGSSVASVLSTSMTSLITATTQMSDNETVVSETTATPIKNNTQASVTPMKAPSQDLIKYQHKMKKCDTNFNNLVVSDNTAPTTESNKNSMSPGKRFKGCSVLLKNIDPTMKKTKKLPDIAKTDSAVKKASEKIVKLEDAKQQKEDYDDLMLDENMESDCEYLELEESEAPLPPLYLLRDEGAEKWVLLNDLCNLLKVKSKDAVLKQICPSSPPSQSKDLIRELKMSDFLEKAICLQLFCAGEKLNVRASKVSLVRYNESVKNLLGVQTIRMKMNL